MSELKVEHVFKKFGSLVAVDDVSMTVEKGELRAVIGPNGAGKTTFFNLISGFLVPTSGRILYEEKDVANIPAAARVKHGMARTFQITEIFPELTVRENLRIPVEIAAGYRLSPWISRAAAARVAERIDQLLGMGSLTGKSNALVGALSHGDQRATEIMMALALNPRLLLLDEPTAGMGDKETHDIARLIRRLHKDEKLTVVLIEHDMRVVFNLADRILVLAEGAMLAEGTPDEIARSEVVQAAYLEDSRMTTLALEVKDLQTFYGKSHILHGVSLDVGEGEIVALLGRNGAGKTTTLRSIVGLTPPREGTIAIFGRNTTGWPPYRCADIGLGYVPEGRKIFANLTVEENLKVPTDRPGPWDIARVYKLFPRLEERRSNKGSQLSGGEQEMLSIARALLLNPKLMLFDEPSQGLAPLIVQNVLDVIVAARKEGISVLLVEQNVRAAVNVADRVYILDHGNVVFAGSAQEIARDEERLRALAGASAEKWSID